MSGRSASPPTALPRRDNDGEDRADGDSGEQPEQSRSSRVDGSGRVEDRAEVVQFPPTNLSDYVTGAVIPIDGAWCGGGPRVTGGNQQNQA
jgi:NAD(P)-dependent dehydrogenase (short-subunit alcohol dehydrogenase family)